MIRFAAGACTSFYDGSAYVRVLVLAEHPDGSGARLEIQRASSFDDQDRRLGMDTYCLVIGSGATHYGGVVHWLVDESDVLRIALDASAAEALDGPAIEVALRRDDVEVVMDAMPIILASA